MNGSVQERVPEGSVREGPLGDLVAFDLGPDACRSRGPRRRRGLLNNSRRDSALRQGACVAMGLSLFSLAIVCRRLEVMFSQHALSESGRQLCMPIADSGIWHSSVVVGREQLKRVGLFFVMIDEQRRLVPGDQLSDSLHRRD